MPTPDFHINALDRVIAGIRNAPAGTFLTMSGEMQVINDPESFAKTDGAMPGMQVVLTRLPSNAFPLSIENTKSGDVTVSLGGLAPASLDKTGLGDSLSALSEIDRLLPDAVRGAEAEAYVFGRDGRMNVGDRAMTAWARSPMEAVAKLHAMLEPDFGHAPLAAMEADIHEGGEMGMRRLHDWAQMDIDGLTARLSDEVELHLVAQTRDDEADIGPA